MANWNTNAFMLTFLSSPWISCCVKQVSWPLAKFSLSWIHPTLCGPICHCKWKHNSTENTVLLMNIPRFELESNILEMAPCFSTRILPGTPTMSVPRTQKRHLLSLSSNIVPLMQQCHARNYLRIKKTVPCLSLVR